uniref:Uncharacterized protein n=1 Tax=Oryza sativa subsp. japonica TaxID=39947 RepID=Q69XY3_ORYSJ|nr:hypothetical protein [Oryza sativa Japonica Group]
MPVRHSLFGSKHMHPSNSRWSSVVPVVDDAPIDEDTVVDERSCEEQEPPPPPYVVAHLGLPWVHWWRNHLSSVGRIPQ